MLPNICNKHSKLTGGGIQAVQDSSGKPVVKILADQCHAMPHHYLLASHALADALESHCSIAAAALWPPCLSHMAQPTCLPLLQPMAWRPAARLTRPAPDRSSNRTDKLGAPSGKRGWEGWLTCAHLATGRGLPHLIATALSHRHVPASHPGGAAYSHPITAVSSSRPAPASCLALTVTHLHLLLVLATSAAGKHSWFPPQEGGWEGWSTCTCLAASHSLALQPAP